MTRILGNTVMNISSTKKKCGTHVLNDWSFLQTVNRINDARKLVVPSPQWEEKCTTFYIICVRQQTNQIQNLWMS